MLRSVIAIGLALMVFTSSVAAKDDDLRTLLTHLSAQIGELKDQLAQSNSRIDALERKLAQAQGEKSAAKLQATPPASSSVAATAVPLPPLDKPVVAVGDVKGTFKIPGTDTSIGLGGFIKLDTLFNSVSAGRDKLGDQQLVIAQIPVNGAPGEHSQITLHAKESRLWFKSFTPSHWGDINTYLELDFFGDSATYTYTPRLRHAYGSIGNLLAGQTWSTFLNVAALPDILDIGGSAGAIAPLRQPLIRWTQPFAVAAMPMEFQMALEAPQSRLWAAPQNNESANTYGFTTSPNADRYPDLIARLNFSPEWGSVSLAGLGRQIRYTRSSGFEQQAWGGAVSLAGKINTVGLDTLRFMLNYGDAMGRYASFNTFEDAALDPSGHMKLVNVYSGMLAYQHWWSKAWRSSVAYGFEEADQPDFVGSGIPAQTRQAQSVHANLLWSPILQATIGVEYIYATREVIDGRNGDLHRVQFSTRFNF